MPIAEIINSGILGLTVVAALVGAAGSLFGVILKDFFFSRSFERWKTRQAAERICIRYTDPIFLTASELCNRLEEICERHPAPYLDSKLLQTKTVALQSNTADDPYFQHYKLLSSIYRFCAFLGWLELFRQETVFLESGKSAKNRAVEKKLEAIHSDLADGQLNTANDWMRWHDRLIFREEQRAIGEKMIIRTDDAASIMGYAEFCEKLGGPLNNADQWFQIAICFLVDPSYKEKDFHLIRLKRLIVHLVELMEEMDKSRVRDEQKEWLKKFSSEILIA